MEGLGMTSNLRVTTHSTILGVVHKLRGLEFGIFTWTNKTFEIFKDHRLLIKLSTSDIFIDKSVFRLVIHLCVRERQNV